MLTPSVSFIIATHNRKPALLETLAKIEQCGLGRCGYETLVVDNNGADGSAEAVRHEFPEVNLIRLPRNRGAVARNAALPLARGKYLVFLDDDSYPLPGSIQRMIRHFQSRPGLGAASFAVRLPDGRRECSAYPNVFIGCGVGVRRAAIDEVGAFPDDFFMQAEEYDLSLRLLEAGWDVETFADLHVTHRKSPAARCSGQKMRLDVRNNLLLVCRRFPEPWREAYLREWMTRYWAIASADGRRTVAVRGFLGGSLRHLATRVDQPVSDATFERFARVQETRRCLLNARRELGFRNLLLVDWGKNLLAYRLACESAGVKIVGIADPNLAGQRYREISILSDPDALKLRFDAVVISNLSPAHAAERLHTWRALTPLPVIDLFEADRSAQAQRIAA